MRLWQGICLIVMVKMVGIAIMYTSWTYTDFSYNRIHPAAYQRRIAHDIPHSQDDNSIVETGDSQQLPNSDDQNAQNSRLRVESSIAPDSTTYSSSTTAKPTETSTTSTSASTVAAKPQLNDSELACQFPLLDPWDPTIKDFIKHPKPINCSFSQPTFSSINQLGYLVFNSTAIVEKEMQKNDSINCYYVMLDRDEGKNDDAIKYGPETLVTVSPSNNQIFLRFCFFV